MSEGEVIQRLAQLEHSLGERLERVEQQLSYGQPTFQFFGEALEAHRTLVLRSQPTVQQPVMQWLGIIQQDPELRFPHRKILECLLRNYDYGKGQFTELSSTQLRKQSRVGKGRLRSYLQLLIGKGFIEERDDGYRTHYRIRAANRPEPF